MRLYFQQLRTIPANSPLLLCKYVPNQGDTFFVATRQPSFRRDIVKLSVYGISSSDEDEIWISEDSETGMLVEDIQGEKQRREVFEPRSVKEWNSCVGVLQRYNVKVEVECPYA